MQRTVSLLALALAAGSPLSASEPEKPAPDATAHSGPSTETPAKAAEAPSGDTALPRFAAELAQRPMFVGAAAWRPEGDARARWMSAAPAKRQAARWDYARALIGTGRAPEALGMLTLMEEDDADLALVPVFQLAKGIAQLQLRRPAEAMAVLSGAELRDNAEACAWRMRALAALGRDGEALQQVNCALPAINGRRDASRIPFILAAADAAGRAGRPGMALRWLSPLTDRDPAANVLRGRAYLAMGEVQAGRLRLERVLIDGTEEQKADARLALVEGEIDHGALSPAEAIGKLETVRYSWRGGPIEERALRREFMLAMANHDTLATLRSAATLIGYFEPRSDAAELLEQARTALFAVLAPDSSVPLAQAAGLYWDYRELAPAGPDGDRLVDRLADRLQEAGLYERAADLLDHQLRERAQDVVQGPLSIKVASLRILAGQPERAIRVLQETEQPGYSDEMIWDRKRVEAVALHVLGKPEAAMAALDSVPGGELLRAEFEWKDADWERFAATNGAALPGRGPLQAPQQAQILRQAIALAMLGREDGLVALRNRYGSAFEKLPSAGVFDVLTRAVGSVDPATVSAAMGEIPSASPAGRFADLIDAVYTE
ncbi:MAG: hypothetical protein CMN73_15980 [Sphingomonas sp.]|nr:hypothetical protein [Sphingomonas sp.]